MTRQAEPISSSQTDGTSSQFQRRWEHGFAWTTACSAFLALPGLRGFWTLGSIDSAGLAYDQSGQGRALSYNGNPTYNYDGLAPYIDLDGTGDYLSRADEAGLDILGTETYVAAAVRGLTLGGWFYTSTTAATQFLCGKSTGAAAGSSYQLYWLNVGAAVYAAFAVSNGAAFTTVTDATASVGSTWHFVVGRYDPSTTVDVYLDNRKTTVAVAVPAAIANTAAQFTIGSLSAGGGSLLTGRASMCFLCTAMLSDAMIACLFHKTKTLYGVK